jgi:hypothetical protein
MIQDFKRNGLTFLIYLTLIKGTRTISKIQKSTKASFYLESRKKRSRSYRKRR